MKGFLLDTNIPSELTRPHPQQSVCQWLESADDEQLYFSVVSLGEILKGITVLPVSKRRSGLQQWLDETLRPWFEGRILTVNEPIAERWVSWPDNATALEHDLIVVTRNVRDFEGLGVDVFNPWD